jgi:hypothetical protein
VEKLIGVSASALLVGLLLGRTETQFWWLTGFMGECRRVVGCGVDTERRETTFDARGCFELCGRPAVF